jgi:hypothetical protein
MPELPEVTKRINTSKHNKKEKRYKSTFAALFYFAVN